MPSSKAVCWVLGIQWLIERWGFAFMDSEPSIHLLLFKGFLYFLKVFFIQREVLSETVMANFHVYISLIPLFKSFK